MKNPWLIAITVLGIFVLSALLDYLPKSIRSELYQFHADKFFHVAAGYLLMAIGITLLEIRDTGTVFLFALSIGAGWEVFQYVADNRGFSFHEEPRAFGVFESYADLAADMVGAFAYWALHISWK